MVPCGNSISQLSKPCWMKGRGFFRYAEEGLPMELLLKLQGLGWRAQSQVPQVCFLRKLVSVYSSGESSLKPTCSSSP